MIAIIGAGILGLSTARELRAAGHPVTIFDPAPGQGASAGDGRILRQMHSEQRLVQLSVSNHRLWEQWEQQWEQSLLTTTGLLYRGPNGKGRYRTLDGAGIAAQWLADDQRTPLPAHKAPALFEPEAAVIDSEMILQRLLSELEECLVPRAVVGFEHDGQRVTVSDDQGQSAHFQQLIITAGLGLPQLLPVWAEMIAFQPVEHLRLTFPWNGQSERRPAALIDSYRGIYGLSVDQGRAYALGIKEPDLSQAEEQLRDLVADELCGLQPEPQGRIEQPVVTIGQREDTWAVYRDGPISALAAGNAWKWAPLHARALSAGAQRQPAPGPWLAVGEQWQRPFTGPNYPRDAASASPEPSGQWAPLTDRQ